MISRLKSLRRLGVFGFGAFAAFIVACATPTPVPPFTNPGVPTMLVPFTPDTPNLQLPTLLPTVVLPTAQAATPVVIVVTATPTPTMTATTTTVTTRVSTRPRASATPAETATLFPEGVPHVYVTALRVEPATPKAPNGGTFFVTFQNLSGKDEGYNWAVETWDAETGKRFGLTTPQNSPMPIGVSNLSSTGWTVKGLGECHAYRARVVARDDEDNRSLFVQPDGSILWLDFSVCP